TDNIQGLFGQQPSSRQNHAYQLAKRALLQRSHWQQTQAPSSSLQGDRSQPRVPNKAARDLKALIKGPHTWPGYFLDDTSRQMGVDYRGDMGRLRNAFARYQATGNLSVVVVGGSISAGAGATADIIIVEYSLNDAETLSDTPFDNSVRRPFERLLRKLLSYPNKPAVLLLNAYTWFDLGQSSSRNGLYYTGSDRDWVEYLEDWLALHFNATQDLWRPGDKPGPVHLLSSAVPGTYSSYMSVCYNVHVPKVQGCPIVAAGGLATNQGGSSQGASLQ
ncbi:SGNH_hydro domain-containing protein, partial [Haematococcus lacustris]